MLDKQDRERTERLTRLLNRQAKTAEYANSGALPEYKKWVDPAVIEKAWREHEAVSAPVLPGGICHYHCHWGASGRMQVRRMHACVSF